MTPVLKWRIRVPGYAATEPVVHGNCAYLSNFNSLLEVEIDSGTARSFYRLPDLGRGHILYNKKDPSNGNCFGNVTMDAGGRYLFAFAYGEQAWYCFGIPGKEFLWRKPISPNKMTAFGSSLVVDDQFLWSSHFQGSVACWRTSDGEEFWRRTFPTRMYAMSTDGEKLLVPSDSGLLCLDREGKEIWKSNLARIKHPPTVGAGVCFANDGDGIYALDMRNGNVIWSHSSNERFPTGLSLAGEMIYTTRITSIVALRAVDGSLAWEAASTEGRQFQFCFSSLVSTANLLLIGGGFKKSIFAFSREGGEL